jgi:hypothetical protein
MLLRGPTYCGGEKVRIRSRSAGDWTAL